MGPGGVGSPRVLLIPETARRFTVRQETTRVTLPVSAAHRFVTLDISLPDGSSPSGALISIRSSSRSRSIGAYEPRAEFWIPGGDVEISVRASKTATWKRSVAADEAVSHIQATLEWDS